jgi:hypothetical protein
MEQSAMRNVPDWQTRADISIHVVPIESFRCKFIKKNVRIILEKDIVAILLEPRIVFVKGISEHDTYHEIMDKHPFFIFILQFISAGRHLLAAFGFKNSQLFIKLQKELILCIT